jgi:hypothetical protein
MITPPSKTWFGSFSDAVCQIDLVADNAHPGKFLIAPDRKPRKYQVA